MAWQEVCEHADGLIALWGGEGSLIAGDADPAPVAKLLKEAFGDRLYALIARHHRAEEREEEARTILRAGRYGLPLVAAPEVLYHRAARRPLQDVLTCIRHGVTLATAGRRTRPNDEYGLLAPAKFHALYTGMADAVGRTREIAAALHLLAGRTPVPLSLGDSSPRDAPPPSGCDESPSRGRPGATAGRCRPTSPRSWSANWP